VIAPHLQLSFQICLFRLVCVVNGLLQLIQQNLDGVGQRLDLVVTETLLLDQRFC
jgi:hypothetical protein